MARQFLLSFESYRKNHLRNQNSSRSGMRYRLLMGLRRGCKHNVQKMKLLLCLQPWQKFPHGNKTNLLQSFEKSKFTPQWYTILVADGVASWLQAQRGNG